MEFIGNIISLLIFRVRKEWGEKKFVLLPRLCTLNTPHPHPHPLLFCSRAARKSKKYNRMKGALPSNPPEQAVCPPVEDRSLVPKCMPQLVPTMLSLLKAIEPDTIYSGYDSSLPDTSTRLMTTLNRLGGRQVVSAVKWAKALPGEGPRLTFFQ